MLEDNALYLKIANEFFLYDKQVGLKLQRKYREFNDNAELFRVSKILLTKEDNVNYALFVIENIDKSAYASLYISALEIYTRGIKNLY